MRAISQTISGTGAIVSTAATLIGGVAGTQQTLALMHTLLVASLGNPLLMQAALFAARITDRASTARAEVERVQRWVQTNIRYTLDPTGIELLQSAEVTLQKRRGDCDDQTVLVCALLTALGYLCRFQAISLAKDQYCHVYSEVLIDGQWVPCETIRPWPLGKEPDGIVDRMRMVVNAPRGEALSGLFSTFKKVAKKVVNNPLVRVAAGAASGGNSELYYQGRDVIRDAKSEAASKQLAAPAPSPAQAQQVVSATPVQAQVQDFITANRVPLGVGVGVLLIALVLR